jgi:hypothetical protein
MARRVTSSSLTRISFSRIMTLYLDATFHTFVQDDLLVGDYCCKMKGMADFLADLGSPVNDRILVLNIL